MVQLIETEGKIKQNGALIKKYLIFDFALAKKSLLITYSELRILLELHRITSKTF